MVVPEKGYGYITNKCMEFLLPVLKLHNPKFLEDLNMTFLTGVFLWDTSYDKKIEDQVLFIVISINDDKQRESLQKVIDHTDIVVDHYSKSSTKTVIIVKLPELACKDTIINFIAGNYSKMHSNSTVITCFEKKGKEVLDILLKRDGGIPAYIKEVNEHFLMNFNRGDYTKTLDTELSLPPTIYKEILCPKYFSNESKDFLSLEMYNNFKIQNCDYSDIRKKELR